MNFNSCLNFFPRPGEGPQLIPKFVTTLLVVLVP